MSCDRCETLKEYIHILEVMSTAAEPFVEPRMFTSSQDYEMLRASLEAVEDWLAEHRELLDD